MTKTAEENMIGGSALIQECGTDASKWAAAFCDYAKAYGHDIDEEWMIGWFANAIETACDIRIPAIEARGYQRGRAEGYEAGLRAGYDECIVGAKEAEHDDTDGTGRTIGLWFRQTADRIRARGETKESNDANN